MVNALDLYINHFMASIQVPFISKMMRFITSTGNWEVLLPLSIALIVALIYQNRFRKGTISALALVVGVSSSELIKDMVARARPGNALIHLNDYSFPSGHAMMSTIFYLLIYLLYKDNIKNKRNNKIFLSICIAIPVLVSFSRLYLNAHWFTDVVAGMFLGFIWVVLFTLVDREYSKRK